MKTAVFLDKDGTLVEDVPYNVDPDQVRLLPGVRESLRAFRDAGLGLYLISNQPGVARGLFKESALRAVEERLEALLGFALDGYYYCPHHPLGSVKEYTRHCRCRKPEPGLLRRAAREHELDLARSWFIGDILHDVEAGRRAGCRTILVDNGGETEWQFGVLRRPHHVVGDFSQAAEIVLARARPGRTCLRVHGEPSRFPGYRQGGLS